MDDVIDDGAILPETNESMLSIVVPMDVLDRSGSRKRKRSVCPGNEWRRVDCSEGKYYNNEGYYLTWRSYSLNK